MNSKLTGFFHVFFTSDIIENIFIAIAILGCLAMVAECSYSIYLKM